MFEIFEEVFTHILKYSILILELVGAIVILFTAAKSIVSLIKHKQHIRLDLAKGIALALEFKLGSEVLRTAIVRDFHELFIAGAIVLLRAAITFLIHWEIKTEEARIDKA